MKTKEVVVVADNIVSPLGFNTEQNFSELIQMHTGLRQLNDPELSPEPIWAGKIEASSLQAAFQEFSNPAEFSRFEQMLILSIREALKQVPEVKIEDPRTLLIISTTKGNIEYAGNNEERSLLWNSGDRVASFFKKQEKPVIVSNACISGILALLVAKRMLATGKYDHAVVCGADCLTPFVVSGFLSFKAVSDQIAKPYDAERNGISLGEGAATIVLSVLPMESLHKEKPILLVSGASSNDANHISGPSRTGDGLYLAIHRTLELAHRSAHEIDFISGHGTATLYNDEMEALAIHDAGLASVPMNSLKSYFGHTLGAAGLIESVIGIESMRRQTLIGTYNYRTPGVSTPLNIVRTTTQKALRNCLKTAAGFGGCNAAVLFEFK